MIKTIGFVTLTTLVWVIVEALTRESDAERRKAPMKSENGLPPSSTEIHKPVEKAA